MHGNGRLTTPETTNVAECAGRTQNGILEGKSKCAMLRFSNSISRSITQLHQHHGQDALITRREGNDEN